MSIDTDHERNGHDYGGHEQASAAPDALPRHQVEEFMIQARPDGQGFVMDLANHSQQAIRLEFPSWMLHQLMRVLPQLDAALQQQQSTGDAPLVAYPMAAWRIEHQGFDDGLVMRLRDNRGVESALHFALVDAQTFHREFGEAIAEVAETEPQAPASTPAKAASKLN